MLLAYTIVVIVAQRLRKPPLSPKKFCTNLLSVPGFYLHWRPEKRESIKPSPPSNAKKFPQNWTVK